jgi:hypothetical protein
MLDCNVADASESRRGLRRRGMRNTLGANRGEEGKSVVPKSSQHGSAICEIAKDAPGFWTELIAWRMETQATPEAWALASWK